MPGRDSHTDNEKENPKEVSALEPETSLAAYRQTVEEGDAGMVFSLIHLDGDTFELMAGNRGNGRYSVYTIKDGAVFYLVDSLTTAELTYFECNGLIAAAFVSWNGGGDEGGYGRQYYQTSADKTLTDGDIPLLSYSCNAVYDGESVYTGEGVTDYFYMGQKRMSRYITRFWERWGSRRTAADPVWRMRFLRKKCWMF